jgi:hypothetical protein
VNIFWSCHINVFSFDGLGGAQLLHWVGGWVIYPGWDRDWIKTGKHTRCSMWWLLEIDPTEYAIILAEEIDKGLQISLPSDSIIRKITIIGSQTT